MKSSAILSVQDFSLGYYNGKGELVKVLRNVNLDIAQGETIGLVGESGCGKSTLALALMGFLRTGSQVLGGDILYQPNPDSPITENKKGLFSLPVKQMEALRGKQIGLIPQNAGQSLTPTMTVGQQLEEALKLHSGLAKRVWPQRCIELLEQVRLPAPEAMLERYPHQLSGGQQQRVAIAMALAGSPDVLLLDEPTTGLDVTTQAHILELLRDLRTELGTSMVFVSHDLGVIARISDRIAVMYAGEVIELGQSADVLRHPAHAYTRGLLASIPRLHQKGLPPAMPGYPPKVGSVSQGCAFAPRCAQRLKECEVDNAPIRILESICTKPISCMEKASAVSVNKSQGTRQVRCHLPEESLIHKEPVQLIQVPKHEKGRTLLSLDQIAVSYQKSGWLDQLMTNILTQTGLKKNRETDISTVDDISLTVNRGETLALVGESGSGKSTIMKAISGVHAAQNGDIQLAEDSLNQGVDKRHPSLKRRVQMIFQNPDASLNPRHTVADILAQPLKLYYGLTGDDSRAKAAELLSKVRLGTHYLDRMPGQLSGGEKQRVAIARCFAGEPELILCDEVTSALDVSVQAAVLKLLKELQAEKGVTYLFIAHDLAVVQAIADQVAVLYQGRLVQVGPVDEVFKGPYHPYTETLLKAVLEPDPDHVPELLASDQPEQHPPVQGCAYQRRCNQAKEQCYLQTPPWQQAKQANAQSEQGNEHNRIRCHLPLSVLATDTPESLLEQSLGNNGNEALSGVNNSEVCTA